MQDHFDHERWKKEYDQIIERASERHIDSFVSLDSIFPRIEPLEDPFLAFWELNLSDYDVKFLRLCNVFPY